MKQFFKGFPEGRRQDFMAERFKGHPARFLGKYPPPGRE
jgi:hypothetical protein